MSNKPTRVERAERESIRRRAEASRAPVENAEPVALLAAARKARNVLFIIHHQGYLSQSGGKAGNVGDVAQALCDLDAALFDAPTPIDLDARLREARRSTLEEAAQVADTVRIKYGKPTGDAYTCALWDQGIRIAAAIRALSEEAEQ